VTPDPSEQKNPYEGNPSRAWIRIRLEAFNGSKVELKLIADTGAPFAFVVSSEVLGQCNQGDGPHANTNFGILEGAWFRLALPELGLTQKLFGYASDDVVTSTKLNRADFDGLAGLPLLRLLEYGGNAEEFWIRKVSETITQVSWRNSRTG